MTLGARVAAGALAGVAATYVMDAVTEIFYTQRIAQREAQIARRSAAAAVALKMLDALGLEPNEDDARKVATILHWAIGVTSGAAAGALASRDQRRGGTAAALAAAGMLAFDEFGLSAIGATPPSSRYPWQTNLRSVAGHGAYALALAAGYALLRDPIER